MKTRPLILMLAALALAAMVAAPVASAAKKKPRPSAKVVKKLFSEDWDTEFEHTTGGPGTISLRFTKLQFGKTRRSGHESLYIPYGTWKTPVRATIVQTIRQESKEIELSSPFVQPESAGTRTVTVTRIVAVGDFYRTKLGWQYVKKGAKTKELSRKTESL
jgi:hypothetical protein